MSLWILMVNYKYRFSQNCTWACAQSLSHVQLFATLYCSPPGSSVCGIFQARILEWVAISYSRGSSWPRERTQVCCVSCTGRQIVCYYCHLGSPLGPFRLVQLLSNTVEELLDWRRATMCWERDLPGSSVPSTPCPILFPVTLFHLAVSEFCPLS